MTKNTLTKLGAALAIAFAVATPIMAAAPADAATMITVDRDHGMGPTRFVRYENRNEKSYRDMYWQREIRFHQHDRGWLRHHHFERDFVR